MAGFRPIQEIGQQGFSVLRAHGFGMELHPIPWPVAIAQSHDLIVVSGSRRDIHMPRKGCALDDEGVVTHAGEILGNPLEQSPPVVADGTGAPMPRTGPGNDARAREMGQTLVAQANAEHGKLGEKLQQIPADSEVAGISGMTGSRGEYGRVQLPRQAG
jgi:hypothetical protein